jgi:hypothetical protein
MITDIKTYGLNIVALYVSVLDGINPYLQAVSLVLAIVYTTIQIYQKLK